MVGIKRGIPALLAVMCVWLPGMAICAVVTRVGIPNESDGKALSCRNPERILGVVRNHDSTVVFQALRSGVQWNVELPAMAHDYDQFHFAPDGSAVVVAISSELAYLVGGEGNTTRVDGEVLAVDFQNDLALIATADDNDHTVPNTDPEAVSGTRVRVFDSNAGNPIAESWFEDTVPTAMKPFLVRLSGDGQSYYYIQRTDAGGEVPVIRDVVSGDRKDIGAAGAIAGFTDDVLMHSSDNGYLLISGKVFALRDDELIPVHPSDEVGNVTSLVESVDPSIQPVTGDRGWGVFDTSTGAWVMAGEGGSLHASQDGLVVENISISSRRIETYDFSSPTPRLVRAIAPGALNDSAIACSNAFGFMSYQDGRFKWHPSK